MSAMELTEYLGDEARVSQYANWLSVGCYSVVDDQIDAQRGYD